MWQKSFQVWQFFLYAIVPWLVVRTPSIIVGLTNYPKVQGVWKNIVAPILQLLSTSEHKDSPNTYKAPFKFGTPPVGTLELPAEPTKKTPPPTPGSKAALVFAAIGTIAVGVCATLVLSGCAGATPYTVYSTTLSGIERADSAAVTSFEKFDGDYQLSIVEEDKAGGRPDRAAPDLAMYRQKRVRVVGAQTLVSSLIRGAHALLPLVEAKKASVADIEKVLQQLVSASASFEAALGEITGTTKVVPAPSPPPMKPASQRDPGDQWPGWALAEVRS